MSYLALKLHRTDEAAGIRAHFHKDDATPFVIGADHIMQHHPLKGAGATADIHLGAESEGAQTYGNRKLVADAVRCGSDTYKNPAWRELCMKPPVERRNGLKRPPGERSRSDVSGRIVLAAYFSGTGVKELGISMIGSIGGFNPASYAATAALNRSKAVSSTDSSSSSSQSVGGGAKDDFLKYMKMSPGERMEENWLRAHGLSREKLAALPPKEREAIMKQMKQDIEKKLKDQAEQKAAKVDITV